ncbi:MAG: NTP transferase domain-containing protein [Clostridiales bacterium]|nr:NTP transferase domain-containing protein [Clostridiales bacterium]
MISKKQFDILYYLKDHPNETQRSIAKAVDLSVGNTNKQLTLLTSMEYIYGGMLTQQGEELLEQFRVKRAVIIAAGFGSRMLPITLNTPKPLIRVKGQRIIDSTIDALLEAGIDDIIIVRGYLGEQFDQLLYKYPMLKFVQNDAFNEANNISSAYIAREFIKNAYVLEADLVLYNKALITPYQYSSNYLGVPVEKTDDWCLYTDNKRITKVAIGGTDCYHMFGISYWTEADGLKLVDDLADVYQAPGGRERYWDQVPLEYHLDHYDIAVRPCTFEDIIEIDTFSELKEIDQTYAVK